MCFFFQAEDGIRDWRDWSSDVCSSDLRFFTTAPEKSTVSQPRNLILMGGGSRAMIVESYVGLEIGRASCRERVEMSVGAGEVKRKKRHINVYEVNNTTTTQKSWSRETA